MVVPWDLSDKFRHGEQDQLKIDIHNHYYPETFLKELEKGTIPTLKIICDEVGRNIIVHKGTRVVTITPPMNHVELRLKDMAKAGIDLQVLSLSIPSVDAFPADVGVIFAQMVNEELSMISKKYPNKFAFLATTPLKAKNGAIVELDRSVRKLGAKGVILGSNIDGRPLDSPEFRPFFSRVSELDIPILIHPMTPVGNDAMNDYRLAPMIGFEMDLCLATVRIVMGGILRDFPNLKFIISHLGGAIPYLTERIENCFRAYPECKVNIQDSPKSYLSKIYMDTISFHTPALMCAYAFPGPKRLILGSDYPHVIGDLERAVSSIQALKIPKREKEWIFSENLKPLLRMSQPPPPEEGVVE
jgi:aminocarboxymuconate-semialdehyde decarboxylase